MELTPCAFVLVLLEDNEPLVGVATQLTSASINGLPLTSVNVVFRVMTSVPFASACTLSVDIGVNCAVFTSPINDAAGAALAVPPVSCAEIITSPALRVETRICACPCASVLTVLSESRAVD